MSRGLTQEQLAVKLGKSQSAVDHWEAGRRIPRRSTAEKLDRTLKAGGRVMRAFGFAPDRAASVRPVSRPVHESEEMQEFRLAALVEMQRLSDLLELHKDRLLGLRADVDELLRRERTRPGQESG